MTDSDIVETLASVDARFLRVLWCDNANVIRAKAIHRDALADHIAHGVGISPAQQALPVMFDAPVAGGGLGPVGEIRLQPDWSSLGMLPYAPGHARVMGDMVVDGAPWEICPRDFLRRTVWRAGARGLQLMAAFENEFYLLQRTDAEPAPSDNSVFAATLAMDRQHRVIDAIATALGEQGIRLEQYYPESGPGQHEISMRHTAPMTAADQQIVFRETVRAIAMQHELIGSFLPKVFPDKAGSGCHLHVSLWRDGHNQVSDPTQPDGLSTVARQFIAGVLCHLPALMAITTPTPNSYRRLQPHCWSGAFRCWGIDNREAAVRVPSDPAQGIPTNIELKTVDATANPYLALGAVIAAGLDGIRQSLDPGEPLQVDPGDLTDQERQRLGIDRLPVNLPEALGHLSEDEVLLEALGPQYAKTYMAIRHAESDALSDLDLSQEVALLLERY